MEEILISLGIVTITLTSIIAHYWSKSKLIDNGIPEPIAEEISDMIEEKIQDVGNDILGGTGTNTPKKKGRPKKSITTLVFILFALSLNSCSLLTGLWDSEKDKFHFSYDRLSPIEKPLDSLAISQKASYLVFDENSINESVDYTFNKEFGSFWILRTGSKFRIEFTPKDTIIRIYKGK